MTVAAVAFDGGRVNDAEALGTVWTDLGGGKASSEPDFVWQNNASVSEKVGTSEGGVALDMVATVDYTTPKVWIAKVIATNSTALNNKGSTGGILEIGSGGIRSAYDRYYVVGGDTYPGKESWLIIPIDPNGGNQSARPGSAPTLTAIDYYGWACDFGATSKSENVAMDAVDWINNGTGLTITLGNGADPDGDFADFVTYDEGTSANRYGIVHTKEGIIYVTGVLSIGDSGGTETDFSDSDQVIVFPDAEFLNSVGFFGININCQNASSVIAITDCVFKSRGTTGGTVDTRPDYQFLGTSGVGSFTGCTFDTFRNFTLTSVATLTTCKILGGELVTQASGTIDGCTFSGGTGTHYVLSNNPTNVKNSDFTQGASGHAVRCDTTGTYTWSNTDTGYTGTRGTNMTPSSGSTDAAFYNNSGGLITLNVSAGADQPSVRNGSGATTQVNATITVTVTPLATGSECRAYLTGTSTEVDGTESSSGGSHALSLSSGVAVDIRIHKYSPPYTPVEIINKSFTVDQNLDPFQRPDLNFDNP
jgi:hypothetical protein